MYCMDHPTTGIKKLTAALANMGYAINEKRVRRLTRLVGFYPIMPRRKNVTKNDLNHVHPYLLRDLEITRPNQAWSTDQGSQYTTKAGADLLRAFGISISMDGR